MWVSYYGFLYHAGMITMLSNPHKQLKSWFSRWYRTSWEVYCFSSVRDHLLWIFQDGVSLASLELCSVSLVLCVLMMWSDWGLSLGERENIYFSRGSEMECFLFVFCFFVCVFFTLSARESSFTYSSTWLEDLWFKVFLANMLSCTLLLYM